MSTGNSSILSLYKAVIENVVEKMQNDFINAGIDETVLTDLRSLWLHKLYSASAISGGHSGDGLGGGAGAGSEYVAEYGAGNPAELEDDDVLYASTTFPFQQQQQQQQPQQPLINIRPKQPQFHQFDGEFSDNYEEEEEEDDDDNDVDEDVDGNDLVEEEVDEEEEDTEVEEPTTAVNSRKPNLKQSTKNTKKKLDKTTAPTTTSKGTFPNKSTTIAAPALTTNHTNTITTIGGDEDALNSDLDDDEEGQEDTVETSNRLLCQFEKVTRSRNRWKCVLKDGIASINGKDYAFHKAQCDLEF